MTSVFTKEERRIYCFGLLSACTCLAAIGSLLPTLYSPTLANGEYIVGIAWRMVVFASIMLVVPPIVIGFLAKRSMQDRSAFLDKLYAQKILGLLYQKIISIMDS